MSSHRTALAKVSLSADTNLGTALELLVASDGKQESVGKHTREVLKEVRAPADYGRAHARREAALRALRSEGRQTRVWQAECAGRFILGLGDPSVRETGLRLLAPWGVPYIPGSSLKGIAAAAAHGRGDDWAGAAAPSLPGQHHAALFGSTEESGLVTFHDAWWIPPDVPEPRLPVHLDVMTPHHPEYYAGKGAPLDTDEPVPVTFVSASGTYLFALSGPEGWLELARELLEEALRADGVGGKTAGGYGRFVDFKPVLTAEEVRGLDARRGLRDIAARDRGPSTCQAVAQELLAAREVLAAEQVVDVMREMMARNGSRKTWKKWLNSDARTDDERWLIQAIAAPSEDVGSAGGPATASGESPKVSTATGSAWTTRKKKKVRVHFDGVLDANDEVVTDERRVKDVDGAGGLSDEPRPVRGRFEQNGEGEWRLVAIEGSP